MGVEVVEPQEEPLQLMTAEELDRVPRDVRRVALLQRGPTAAAVHGDALALDVAEIEVAVEVEALVELGTGVDDGRSHLGGRHVAMCLQNFG